MFPKCSAPREGKLWSSKSLSKDIQKMRGYKADQEGRKIWKIRANVSSKITETMEKLNKIPSETTIKLHKAKLKLEKKNQKEKTSKP